MFKLPKLPFSKKGEEEIPEKIFEAEALSINDIVAPASIEDTQSYIKIGERMVKCFFVFSYPRYLSTAWLAPLINLDASMNISMFFHPIEGGLILKQLRTKVTQVQAEIMEREEKGLIRDPALETAYGDIESLRQRLQTAQERMFKFGLYLAVYVDEEKELREIETSIRSILESKLIYVKPALYQQRKGFISCSPYGLDQLDVHTAMNTGPLSTTFPFVSFDLSSNEGILYGVNQHNNSLVLFDRFTLENANSCLFAKAGSGKSIKGSEPVLIKNKNKIQLTQIGPLVENLIKKRGISQIDEELEGVVNPGIEVYSFDKELKGRWSKVTVAARKKAPEIFYKFSTRSGRQITTTADHNMLLIKNGKVVAAKSSEVEKGEFIPLPKQISETEDPLKYINLLTLLENSKGVYVYKGEKIIKENYRFLKQTKIDEAFDRYLYKYRDGRPMPVRYFRKILGKLDIKPEENILTDNLTLSSRNGRNRVLFDLNFPIKPSFLKIMGYITAEGTIGENCIMIANKDPEILKDLSSSFKDLGIPFYYGNNGLNSGSRVLIEIVKKLNGGRKSAQKIVPPFIFNLEKEKIAQYLTGYFEGDAGVEKCQIVATSKSKKLISEIAYLLYYFGIVGRISKTKKRASNWKQKKDYYKLTISGQGNLNKFAQSINFISVKKKRLLLNILKKEGNTNVDIIPGLESIFNEIYQLFSSQISDLPEISEWKRAIRRPSPEHLNKIIEKIEQKIQNFKNLAPNYKILGELPELAAIINLGKNNEELNRLLRRNLGWSWKLMKNQKINPRSANVLTALSIVRGNDCPYCYSSEKIKETIHSGFLEMDLSIKSYNPSLQPQLAGRIKHNTDYNRIQGAAHFIWQNYQDVLMNKIPQLEENLNQLKILANSNLFWDPIVKIEKVKNIKRSGICQNKEKDIKEKYVYDLTVDDEVFLSGYGGMFIHNSFSVKLELLRYLMLGVDCIVIDPENEYKFLADAVGGSYFDMSLSSPNHINPFDLPFPREDEDPRDVLRGNIINLVGLIRIMLGGLTPEEDAILDRAIAETYAARDITPESDPKIWGENIPLMSDLEAVLETMEGAESLTRRIGRFTSGVFAEFFNQPSNVDMKNKFTVFGIRDMEEELRPMAMFIILRYIWSAIRSRIKKRILVVDEAWWLMKTEDGASFLYGIAKRARKYWLGVTTITQDIGDFMKSEYGKPIITNSSLQFLMKQSPATLDVVQKTFNLTEAEKNMLLECAVGEGLFFAGQKHVAIRVVASYAEDQLITTAPEEVLRIKEAKRELEE